MFRRDFPYIPSFCCKKEAETYFSAYKRLHQRNRYLLERASSLIERSIECNLDLVDAPSWDHDRCEITFLPDNVTRETLCVPIMSSSDVRMLFDDLDYLPTASHFAPSRVKTYDANGEENEFWYTDIVSPPPVNPSVLRLYLKATLSYILETNMFQYKILRYKENDFYSFGSDNYKLLSSQYSGPWMLSVVEATILLSKLLSEQIAMKVGWGRSEVMYGEQEKNKVEDEYGYGYTVEDFYTFDYGVPFGEDTVTWREKKIHTYFPANDDLFEEYTKTTPTDEPDWSTPQD